MSKSIPTVSVVMPVYNVERFVGQAIASVLTQTFSDFELIIVDDGGSDSSLAICERMADDRTRIIRQVNRGLPGARNTGIGAARGAFIALLDSDDMWEPDKLARHVAHLRTQPDVGVSYAGAVMIDGSGRDIGLRQTPRVGPVSQREVFCGLAICNGSTPVFRREVLDAIAYYPVHDDRPWYFDETFRRSEDVECWVRISLTTPWRFEGIAGYLTRYRLNSGGLSADVVPQLASWDAVRDKVAGYAPGFVAEHGAEARARELRYLARRCVQMRDRGLGISLALAMARSYPALFWQEPRKTAVTFLACVALRLLPAAAFKSFLRSLQPRLVEEPL
jgi:glycosyltransferase involved in cell wall biosynthesis